MEVLSIFILWIRPAFWSQDAVMYLVLWAFTSSPISLVAATKASAFFFTTTTVKNSVPLIIYLFTQSLINLTANYKICTNNNNNNNNNDNWI